MRTLVHISDLHFGRVDPALTEPLLQQIRDIKPDLVIVSGDLTQRARTYQFIAARDFLARIPLPKIIVPGNHDVPAYNLFRRFLDPLSRYRRYITADRLPCFIDEEIAVFGFNSTLSLTTKHGRLREDDISQVCSRLMTLPSHIARIVVLHHPFDLPPNGSERDLLRHASLAMQALAGCRVDLILSGHLHLSHVSETGQRYRIAGHSAVVVQAGTALSVRQRGETNSFNVLRLAPAEWKIERRSWNPGTQDYSDIELKVLNRSTLSGVPDKFS
jgi:3',5'-cyclic AMP phosphodiesterase CpdA